ncbi:PR domain zinc finger protein 1-like [Anolis sagrei]|uniref:PR domain zinc finger protein 1-like n=1 Tax=Anolis sagrei TaxID=38937 RepID=UPI0035206E49
MNVEAKVPWKKGALEEQYTYVLMDQRPEPKASLPWAQASLPRNLAFQYDSNNQVKTVVSREYIPQGTCFGPLVGKICTGLKMSRSMDPKHFWKVFSSEGELHHILAVNDPDCCNWMCYVNSAEAHSNQNLMAIQYNLEIYFYTVTPILDGEELLVWDARDISKHIPSLQPGNLISQPECSVDG